MTVTLMTRRFYTRFPPPISKTKTHRDKQHASAAYKFRYCFFSPQPQFGCKRKDWQGLSQHSLSVHEETMDASSDDAVQQQESSSIVESCHLEGSVVLNNAAVTLFEQKRYLEAAEKLRDSLNLMNGAMKERTNEGTGGGHEDAPIPTSSSTELNSARPSTSKVVDEGNPGSASSEIRTGEDNQVGFEARSMTMVMESASFSMAASSCSEAPQQPVRILQVSKTPTRVVDIELLTSIILFNYALARCSMPSKDKNDNAINRETALRLHEMAWALISSMHTMESDRDLPAAEPVLVVAKAILQQIVTLRAQKQESASNTSFLEDSKTVGFYQLLHSTSHTLVMAQSVKDFEAFTPAGAA